jgi:hypothetical protein
MAQNGLRHTTTLEAVQQQRAHTIGDKRKSDDELTRPFQSARTLHDAVSDGPLVKRRFGNEPSQLQPSRISIVPRGAHADGLPSEYSQRRDFPATPTSTVDPLLSLSHRIYDLPFELVANFASLGIRTIYPWQKACLLGPGLLQGEKNLVYSAPTGGGKSLVADVLMLKRVLAERDAKALLVLPYVALVQEKVRWLRNVVQGISRGTPHHDDGQKPQLWAPRADRDAVRVVGFFGGSKTHATWADFDIAVCTMEKVGLGVPCLLLLLKAYSPALAGEYTRKHCYRRLLHLQVENGRAR